MRTKVNALALVLGLFCVASVFAQNASPDSDLPPPLRQEQEVTAQSTTTGDKSNQDKTPPQPIAKSGDSRKFTSHEILVQLKTDDARLLRDPGNNQVLAGIYKEFGAPEVKNIFLKPARDANWDAHIKRVKEKFGVRAKRSHHKPGTPLGRFYKLSFQVADDKLLEIAGMLRESAAFADVSLNKILHANVVPDDPYFASTGTWGETYRDMWGLVEISSTRAWRTYTSGVKSVIVGVIDTGLDFTHADITDNLYANASETAGDGVDNDGNGYVDDSQGWDFVNSDADPTDDHYHGTHVSGTIAATGNNATGVVGVMWDAQILAVKALNADGDGDFANIASAVVYAADQGADVINMSLGGGTSSTLEAAVAYASSLGVVIVAAAGNDRADAMDQAPAMYDESITVGASTYDDELASFSNFGPKIDVTAPGQDILSLLAAGGTSADASNVEGTNYYRASGTSMAAPHVSGAAGLLLSHDATMTVEEVRQAIRQTTDIGSAGWDEETGNGNLNLFKALRKPTKCEALITDPDANGEVQTSATVSGYAGGTDFARYRIKIYEMSGTTSTYVAGSAVSTTAVSDGALATITIPGFTPGTDYSIRLTVSDSAGRVCGRDRKEVSGSYLLGTYDTAGRARSVALSGNYAYVADFTSGTNVIDVSSPASPTLAGSYAAGSNYAQGIVLSGSYVYVADGYSGLRIIDVSTPTSPTLVGTYDTAGYARGVFVSGTTAYVADNTSGLVLIDVTTPASPTLIGSYDTSGTAYGVAVSGNYAYVADVSSGIQVVDISTPTAPTLTATYDTDGMAYNVAISGNYAYVADYDGMLVLDVSTPTSPSLTATYESDGTIYGVALDGDFAYVAAGENGLEVVDISVPTVPFLAWTYATTDWAYAVAIDGDQAVVADDDSGVQIFSLTAPLPEDVAVSAGSYDTPGTAYAIDVDGGYVYVADGSYGLQVVDLSAPESPTLAGTYDTTGSAYGITVSGSYAYVADSSSGLQIIDVSTPSLPTLTATYNTSGQAKDVTLSGSTAYVADYDSGLQIIDVSTPGSPTLIGSYDTTGSSYGVFIDGNTAYVADADSGLQIIDITTPASPTLIGSYDTDGEARAVVVDGTTAYVADSTSGVQIIDVSTPTAPTLVANYATESYTLNVAMVDGYLYMSDGYTGLQILDVSVPASPTLVTSWASTSFTFEVDSDGTYTYVADWKGGLVSVYVRLR